MIPNALKRKPKPEGCWWKQKTRGSKERQNGKYLANDQLQVIKEDLQLPVSPETIRRIPQSHILKKNADVKACHGRH